MNLLRIPLYIWLFLLVFLSPCFGAGTVRVATYNLENYLLKDGVTASGWRPDYPKTERGKAALRAVIARVNPDVLAVQEMGSAPFLRELQRDLRSDGLDYFYTVLLKGEDEERHLAVLSKLPFVAVHEHVDLTFPYFGKREPVKRGLLEVVFETEGERWSLFVVHLKSKWTERPDDPEATVRRTGEATAARDRILERQNPEAGALFLIVGDFNTTRDTAPIRRFLGKGAVKIAEIIPATDARGHTWTHHWERQDLYSRIDFLLASPRMNGRVAEGQGRIYDGSGYEAASDHRLVWADLQFGEKDGGGGERGESGLRLVQLLREFSGLEGREESRVVREERFEQEN